MTREEAKALQKKYNMVITRDTITRQAYGLMVESHDLIPELDEIADNIWGDFEGVACERVLTFDTYTYSLYLPEEWFDLWGWVDE